MLSFEGMAIRFLIALLLGAIIGIEREIVGKEAGVRTSMLVSGGAAIFTMISVVLPYLIAVSDANLPDVIARNSGFLGVIANIVVGIGFLGAGIIIKTGEHVRGLTTAAVVWITAAIGTLVGLGILKFAVAATLTIAVLLYVLRKIGLVEHLRSIEDL
ncbi:MAG: MgtC/SapB family protein [Parcubacteria group bacterium]|nr:MgtC/SapB family protein [Parcubacteria group bacterium]